MTIRRLLITGGCGFIGANLIEHLQMTTAPEIRVLDNESLGRQEYIAEFDVDFVKGDIRDEATLRLALDGVDAVVHLAADTRVMDSITNPTLNFQTNVVGTFKLLMMMRELDITRIVNASTGGAILGEATPPIDENMVAQPLAPYGASKLAVEGYLSAFAGAYGFRTSSLRFSNVYGPRSYHKGSVVAHFFKQILDDDELVVYGDGNQTRDYVFAGDLVLGIGQALESDMNGVFQLGTGRPTSLNDLIELMRETVRPGREVRVRYADFRPGEIRHTWCDIDKARTAFGYNPATLLNEGLRPTWQWFREVYAPV